MGRFIGADSIVPEPGNPQSLNRYSYVRNSPLNRIDPNGHEDESECLADVNCVREKYGGGGAGHSLSVMQQIDQEAKLEEGEQLSIFQRFLKFICGGCVYQAGGKRGSSNDYIPGQWQRLNAVANDPNVVAQCRDNACVPASGEMLLKDRGINVSQQRLAKALAPEGEKDWAASSRTLPRELNKYDSSGGWQGGYLGETSVNAIKYLSSKGSWAAEMKTQDPSGHMVVVEGFDGSLLSIKDPWNGMSYQMQVDEFLKYWIGAVWRE